MEQTETEKQVLKIIESRFKKGRETYGEGISYKQCEDPEKWLNEAIEEAADMLQYLVAAKMAIERRQIK